MHLARKFMACEERVLYEAEDNFSLNLSAMVIKSSSDFESNEDDDKDVYL